MDRMILNNKGWAGLFVILVCFLFIGVILMISTFTIGSVSYSKNHLQNILDLAVDRAALGLEEDTEEILYALGEGYTIYGEKTNHFLRIDKNKVYDKFYDELSKNLNLSSIEVILATPINFNGDTYSFVLDGTNHEVNNIHDLEVLINNYLTSKSIPYFVNIDNNVIDRPTYCAIVAFDSPLFYLEPIILHSFSGGQSFRRY